MTFSPDSALEGNPKRKRCVTQLDLQAFAGRYLSIFLLIFSAVFSGFEKLEDSGTDNAMMRVKTCQRPPSAYKYEMSISLL